MYAPFYFPSIIKIDLSLTNKKNLIPKYVVIYLCFTTIQCPAIFSTELRAVDKSIGRVPLKCLNYIT